MEVTGILSTGIVAGLAIFISRLLYAWLNKPILKIEGSFEQDALAVDEKWKQIGVEVRNCGESVAKNCRGVLTIHDFESKEDIVDPRIWKGRPAVHWDGGSSYFDQLEAWHSQHNMETAKKRAINLNDVQFFLDRRVPGIDFREKEVHWDYPGSPIDLNINKGDKNRLFVARLRYKPRPDGGWVGDAWDMIDIPSGYGWDKRLHVCLRTDKNYTCTLKISSANADSVERKIILDSSGRIILPTISSQRRSPVPTWP